MITTAKSVEMNPLVFSKNEIQKLFDSLNVERDALQAERWALIEETVFKCGEVVERFLNSSTIINEPTFVNFLKTNSDLSDDEKKVARELLKGYLLEKGVVSYCNFDNELANGIDISDLKQNNTGVKGVRKSAAREQSDFSKFLGDVANGTNFTNSVWWNSLMITCDFIPGVNILTTIIDSTFSAANSLASYFSDPESYGANFWAKGNMSNEEAAGVRLGTELAFILLGMVPGLTRSAIDASLEGFTNLVNMFKNPNVLKNFVKFIQDNIGDLAKLMKNPKELLEVLSKACPEVAQFIQSVIYASGESSSNTNPGTVGPNATNNTNNTNNTDSVKNEEDFVQELFNNPGIMGTIQQIVNDFNNGIYDNTYTFDFGDNITDSTCLFMAEFITETLLDKGIGIIFDGIDLETGKCNVYIFEVEVISNKNDKTGNNGKTNDSNSTGKLKELTDEEVAAVTAWLMELLKNNLLSQFYGDDYGHWTGEDAQESFEELLDAINDGTLDEWFDKWGSQTEGGKSDNKGDNNSNGNNDNNNGSGGGGGNIWDDLGWFYEKFDPLSPGGNRDFNFGFEGQGGKPNPDDTRGMKNADVSKNVWK